MWLFPSSLSYSGAIICIFSMLYKLVKFATNLGNTRELRVAAIRRSAAPARPARMIPV